MTFEGYQSTGATGYNMSTRNPFYAPDVAKERVVYMLLSSVYTLLAYVMSVALLIVGGVWCGVWYDGCVTCQRHVTRLNISCSRIPGVCHRAIEALGREQRKGDEGR